MPLAIEKIFDDYCDGLTLADDAMGDLYAYGVVNRVGQIAKRNATNGTWTVIHELENDGTGVEGKIGAMRCRADGSIYLGFSTRLNSGQCGAGMAIPNVCAVAPELPDDLYRGIYGSTNADVEGDNQLGLRLERQRRPVRALLDWAFRAGMLRRKAQ